VSVTFCLSSIGAVRVDVALDERGALRVELHAADASAASTLRVRLGELAADLEHPGRVVRVRVVATRASDDTRAGSRLDARA
jgi:hypothetical protein